MKYFVTFALVSPSISISNLMKAVANLREHERSPDGIFQLIAGKIRTKIFPKFGHHMSLNTGHLNSVPNYFFIAKKSNKKKVHPRNKTSIRVTIESDQTKSKEPPTKK